MKKRLAALTAALILTAAAEAAQGFTKQPLPPVPSNCPKLRPCAPVATCSLWRTCPTKPQTLPCGGPGQAPCWQ